MQVHEKEDKLQRNEFDLSLPKVTSVKKYQTKTSFAKTRGFPTICLALKGLQRLAAGAKLLEGKLRVSRGWLEGHLLMKRMKCSGFCSVLKGHLERHIDGMQMAMKNPILMF